MDRTVASKQMSDSVHFSFQPPLRFSFKLSSISRVLEWPRLAKHISNLQLLFVFIFVVLKLF